jgi:hypothetical protein
MKRMSRLSIFAYAALGMMAGYGLAANAGRFLPKAFADTGSDVVAARGFELVDDQGRRQILIATSNEGSPSIWFFDKNGKARLNLGLYGDGNAAVVLNDDAERAVEIFRTVGPRSAPVLVMKSNGTDRIIMGVNDAADPYLVTFDQKGGKKAVFGNN